MLLLLLLRPDFSLQGGRAVAGLEAIYHLFDFKIIL
jgi:hypothetical protein